MIAAMAPGTGVLPGPDNPPVFDMGIMMVAMVIHFLLSIILGLLISLLVLRHSPGVCRAGTSVFRYAETLRCIAGLQVGPGRGPILRFTRLDHLG